MKRVHSQCEISNLEKAFELSEMIKSSLGPQSRDKLLTREDGEILVTSDGRTLLETIPLKHPIHKLMRNLSISQDEQCGDGTTSVIVLCGNLCREAKELLDKYHQNIIQNYSSQLYDGHGVSITTTKQQPFFRRIIDAFKKALQFAIQELEILSIPFQLPINSMVCDIQSNVQNFLDENHYSKDGNDKQKGEHHLWIQNLVQVAKTSLSSKLVSRERDKLSKICVNAVLKVTDWERMDIDLNLIRFQYQENGDVSETKLYDGIVLRKSLSHLNMPNQVNNARIAVFSCAMEPPKPKTKHYVNISNQMEYKELKSIENQFVTECMSVIKKSKVNVIFCQWGIDNQMNQELAKNGIFAVRWVSGDDLERVAMASGSMICSRVDQLKQNMIGFSKSVSQEVVGKTSNLEESNQIDTIIVLSGAGKQMDSCNQMEKTLPSAIQPCSILVRGTGKIQCEDTIRSLYDAVCNIRNTIINPGMTVGGGAMEIEIYCRIMKWCDEQENQYVMKWMDGDMNSEINRASPPVDYNSVRAWARGLLSIPRTLLDNAGLPSIQIVQQLIQLHQSSKCLEKKESLSVTSCDQNVQESLVINQSCYLGISFDKSPIHPCKTILQIADMREKGLMENLRSKKSILTLATDLVCTILKIDDMIVFE